MSMAPRRIYLKFVEKNVQGTIETLLKYSAEWGVDSEDVAKQAYDEVAPFWRLEPDPNVLEKAMRTICDRAGRPPVPVADFLDTRFLAEALAE